MSRELMRRPRRECSRTGNEEDRNIGIVRVVLTLQLILRFITFTEVLFSVGRLFRGESYENRDYYPQQRTYVLASGTRYARIPLSRAVGDALDPASRCDERSCLPERSITA